MSSVVTGSNEISSDPTYFILSCATIALVWAAIQFFIISLTKIEEVHTGSDEEERASLKSGGKSKSHSASSKRELELLKETYEAISTGAEAFLRAEYSICTIFVIIFAVIIFALVSWSQNATLGFLTSLSFVLGAATSIASGYIGMRVAVYSNVRTTINAQREGFMYCFNTAFRAGSVMVIESVLFIIFDFTDIKGFALTGLGIMVLYITLLQFSMLFTQDKWILMMDCISGYGLGGSSIAMFGRVGGGIYTKAY